MVGESDTAAEAVRAYLEALQDPNAAVPWEQVKELADEIGETNDPVKRVLLRSEWRRTSDPVTYLLDLQTEFIEHAPKWAETNRVSGDDFFYEGVPESVLEQAGLPISEEAQSYLDDEFDSDDEPVRIAGSVKPAVAIRDALGDDPVSVTELMENVEASRNTVRSVLEEMVENGEAVVIENDEDPLKYRKIDA